MLTLEQEAYLRAIAPSRGPHADEDGYLERAYRTRKALVDAGFAVPYVGCDEALVITEAGRAFLAETDARLLREIQERGT
jgi:hypothetical protein